ncbi:MAG TPA: hypothetical protein VK668_21985 [Mucilaginibacter sp.]|nr:hypothetical protein [Mucilaginibacter sp.]
MTLPFFLRRFIAFCQDFYRQDKDLFILLGVWVVLMVPVLIKLVAR